jgi:hypothetical protein
MAFLIKNCSIFNHIFNLINCFFPKISFFLFLWVLNFPLIAAESFSETTLEVFPPNLREHINPKEDDGKLIELECTCTFEEEHIDNLIEFMEKECMKTLKKLTLKINFGGKNYAIFMNSLKKLKELRFITLEATKRNVGITRETIRISPAEFRFLGIYSMFPQFEWIKLTNQSKLTLTEKKLLSELHLMGDIDHTSNSLTITRKKNPERINR